MNWFVKRRNPDALPPLAGPIPSQMREFGLGMREFWLRQDTAFQTSARKDDLIGEMEAVLQARPIARRGQMVGYETPEGPKLVGPNGRIDYLTARMAEARARGAPFAGQFPTSAEEFDEVHKARGAREMEDIRGLMGRGDSPLTQFAGQMAGAMVDPINLLAGAMGGAPKVGQLGWFILREAGLNAAAEVPGALKERANAEFVGLDKPTISQSAMQVALGGAMGAGLAGLIAGGVKGLDLLRTRNAAEKAARPAYIPPADYKASIDAAEKALRKGGEPPALAPLRPDVNLPAESDPAVASVLRFIGQIEAPGGYDQVFSGIARADLPPKPLSQLTVNEVLAWQDSIDPRYGSEAAGQYQMMEDTLRDLVRREGLTGDELFDKATQDRLAVALMRDAGLEDWRAGRIGAEEFNDRLAGIWAAIPEVATGKSRYAGDGVNGARTSPDVMLAVLNGGQAPDRTGLSGPVTSRGYTGSGQVSTGRGTRIDVEYEVVDASLLKRATGDLQPRDRSRAASDEQVAEIAARLDPARLMPSPEADRGAPIVGPDDVIESGNGRVMAIDRAYELHPDRAQAYRAAIEELTGEAIPEGIERPVLIARRKSEFATEADRQSFIREANQSTIARMSASEQARADARDLTRPVFAAYRMGGKLNAPENATFRRRAFGLLPQSERSGLMTDKGWLNIDGLRRMRQALFASAFDAQDILKMVAETESPAIEALLRMLEDIAPDWAAFRSMVDAGQVRPEFDITEALMDAVRLIARARIEDRDGQSVIAAIRDKLAQDDLLAGRDPLVEAIIDAFYKGDRARRPEATGEIFQRYVAEAVAIGRADSDALLGDVTPAEILSRAIDGQEKRTDFTMASDEVFEPDPVIDTAGVDGSPYGDGTASPDVLRADDAIEADLRQAAEAAPRNHNDPLDLGDVSPGVYVRELSQRQPFDDLDDDYRLAEAPQARLVEEGERIADDLGVEFRDPGLKGREDAEEKIGRKSYSSARQLTDISRGGFVLNRMEEGDGLVARLAEVFDLVDEGWTLKSDSNYVDRKVIIRHPDGMLSEVQIWTPEMYKAKVAETEAYKAMRGRSADDPEVAALREKSAAAYSAAIGRDNIDRTMFSPDGTSSSPKLFAKYAEKSASDTPAPFAERQTSIASTLTQSEPGSRIATAAILPDPSLASSAGRYSQLRKPTSVIGEDPSVKDNSSMGASPLDVNSLRSEFAAFADAEITTDKGTWTVRDLLDDLEADRDLADVMEVCKMKRTPE